MMFLFGAFISGLNNLVSASCAADIGKQQALQNSAKSTTTVIGIIDGTGSLGSAIGQFVVAYTYGAWGWEFGYWFIISVVISISLIPLTAILTKELAQMRRLPKKVKKIVVSE